MLSLIRAETVSRADSNRCRHFDREARTLSRATLQANRACRCATRSRMPTSPRPWVPSARTRIGGVEPNAIVFDRDEERVRQTLEVHAAAVGFRVFRHIGQGFLDDPVDRRFGVGREAFVHAIVQQVRPNAVPSAETLSVPLRCRSQAQIVEERGMEQM